MHASLWIIFPGLYIYIYDSYVYATKIPFIQRLLFANLSFLPKALFTNNYLSTGFIVSEENFCYSPYICACARSSHNLQKLGTT